MLKVLLSRRRRSGPGNVVNVKLLFVTFETQTGESLLPVGVLKSHRSSSLNPQLMAYFQQHPDEFFPFRWANALL
jgi:hypothetical protein